MCFIHLIIAAAFWGPIAAIGNTILWYADSKGIELEYMPEMRLILGITGSILPLTIAFCKYGM